MKKVKVTPELIKRLESQGYQVKQKRDLVRKTFVIDKTLLEKFMSARAKRNLKLQDAVAEALADWIKKP